MIERYITPHVRKDLETKIVLISGARQAGKTTLSKSLFPNDYDYLNYDHQAHRLALKNSNWDAKKSLVIFDELHKMPQWKRWLKGIYDTRELKQKILVTGSAKLNTYKKVGDSLAGRYFQFRLHPFDIKEAKSLYTPDEAFERLWNCSGFPEPFLNGEKIFYDRWKHSHLDIILRQDLIDLEGVRDINTMETLIELLKINVGSTISYENLARTVEKDAKTIKKWLQILEELYIIFKVTPYSNKISRSLLKEPKYYFYDCARIENNDGAKLENIVANALLKELHYLQDIYGATTKLHFLKTRDGKELDFLIVINNKPAYIIEVKMSDDEPAKSFLHFGKFIKNTTNIQLVKNLSREKSTREGLSITALIPWLANIDFSAACKSR